MPNNKFPETTLQPLQTLDFVLAGGKRIRTMLLPMPDNTRKCIADVDAKAEGQAQQRHDCWLCGTNIKHSSQLS